MGESELGLNVIKARGTSGGPGHFSSADSPQIDDTDGGKHIKLFYNLQSGHNSSPFRQFVTLKSRKTRV